MYKLMCYEKCSISIYTRVPFFLQTLQYEAAKSITEFCRNAATQIMVSKFPLQHLSFYVPWSIQVQSLDQLMEIKAEGYI